MESGIKIKELARLRPRELYPCNLLITCYFSGNTALILFAAKPLRNRGKYDTPGNVATENGSLLNFRRGALSGVEQPGICADILCGYTRILYKPKRCPAVAGMGNVMKKELTDGLQGNSQSAPDEFQDEGESGPERTRISEALGTG
ncbi:MAG: hypothetical protein ACWGN1_01465 [Desulfobulbales bacterium]